MKTACLKANVSSAKTNILLDGAITAKVKFISFVMQIDTRLFTQQDLITITGLYPSNYRQTEGVTLHNLPRSDGILKKKKKNTTAMPKWTFYTFGTVCPSSST